VFELIKPLGDSVIAHIHRGDVAMLGSFFLCWGDFAEAVLIDKYCDVTTGR
jgi:hypothetical protein